jgi:trans-aconitate methyltransferase
MIQAMAESGISDIWVLGIDRAHPMLEEAWRQPNIPFPAWYVGRDLLEITWPKERIDGITALLVFHLVDDLRTLSSRCLEALKPGGVLAYAVSTDANPFLHMVMRQLRGPGVFFKQGASKIHTVMRETGFEIVRREALQDEIRLESAGAMRDLIASIGGPGSIGLREDVIAPPAVTREFELVWARKPI